MFAARVFIAACGFSLASQNGHGSVVAECGLLTAVASLVAEQRLWCVGSAAAVPGSRAPAR